MANNKSRNSILFMFDPLRTPSTPRRDPSPESGSSDKENDTPPGELTVFFNRVQTFHKTYAPKTPNGKLIDFDTTIDNSSCSDSDEDADATFQLEEQASNQEPLVSTGTSESDPVKRTPLADIMLEETPRPRDVRTLLSIRTDAPFEKDSTPVQNVTAAPFNAPLSEVINSINLSSMTISTPERSSTHVLPGLLAPMPEEEHPEESDGDNEVEDTIAIPLSFPQITVSSPTYSESDSLTESDLPPSSDSPTDRLFASSSSVMVPPMRRPLSAHPIPADDPRRGSVDLQTSFSMHLQSEEMSFDLLNDKISFLGMAPGADSFWAGAEDEDEEFNMEAEERKMEAAAREYEKAERAMSKVKQKQKTAVAVNVLDAPHHAECVPSPPSQTGAPSKQSEAESEVQKTRQLLTRMPVFSVPADIADSVAEEEANRDSSALTAVSPSQPTVSRQSTPEHSQLGEPKNTPAEAVAVTALEVPSSTMMDIATPTSPPLIPEVPIPALRINKKTWKVHGRTESTTSAASSVSSSGTSTSTSVSSGSTNATSASSTHDSKPVLKVDIIDKKVIDRPSSSTDLAVPARAPRTVIRGVQRPPAGSEMLGSAVIVPSTALGTTGQQRLAGQNKLRAASSSAAEARSRFAAAGVQRPNLQQGQRAMPSHMMQGSATSKVQKSASTTSGNGPASTVNAGRAPTVPASRSGGSVSGLGGLRAPTRYGTASGASSAATSALPRPASRLPAPSTGALRGKDAKTFGTSARMGTSARRAF